MASIAPQLVDDVSNAEITPEQQSAGSKLLAATRQLSELNRQYLDLLFLEQTLPDSLGYNAQTLKPSALMSISSCPLSLFSLGFNNKSQWLTLIAANNNTLANAPAPIPESLFASQRLPRWDFVATVIFYAWHLTNHDPLAAKVLLDMDAAIVNALKVSKVTNLRPLAQQALGLLTPRWADNPRFWPDLIQKAHSGDHKQLRATHLLGRQLLAAEFLGASNSLLVCKQSQLTPHSRRRPFKRVASRPMRGKKR